MHKISIGLPVFNGENFLSESIESLLSQTFVDFELIISDNCSTDNTYNICKQYACKDPRIKYYRNEVNIGAAPNFNMTFNYSNGKYFKWMAHDDVCAPVYLEECVKVLDSDPSIILCHSDVQFINAENKIISNDDNKLTVMNSKIPSKRFKECIDLNHWCIDIFGLMRRDVLKRTNLIPNFVGSDRNLLAELSLIGRFYRIPKVLFFHREHSMRSTRQKPLHERAEWWNVRLRSKYHMPHWLMIFRYCSSIKNSSISRKERWQCYLALRTWLLNYWKNMYWDLKVVARNTLQNL